MISGTGGLTKVGTGSFLLTGLNTYSGASNVNSGTLQAGTVNAIGSTSGLTVATGAIFAMGGFSQTVGSLSGGGLVQLGALGTGTLTIGGSNASTAFSGEIGGAGNVVKTGTGTFNLTGTNTYTGATTVNAGTLQMGAANAIASSSGLTVAAGATYDLNNLAQATGSLSGSGSVTLGTATLTTGGGNASTTFDGNISGTGGVTKSGTGTFTLTAANTYNGATAINAGVVNIQNAAALGTTAGGTTVATGAALQIQGGIATSEALSLNGTGVANDGALRNVSGTNTVDGLITLGSTARINADAPFGLNLNGGITGAGQNLLLGGSGNIAVAGAITTGAGSVTKDGTGNVIFYGANTYSGATNVNAGTLQMGAANSISASSGLTVATGATYDLNNFSQMIASLSGSGSVTLGAATLTTGSGNASTAFTGSISGFGNLIKNGTGTFNLTNTNTYTGTTTVNAGTLAVNGSIAASSLTTVNAGSTIGGTGTVGNLTINGGTLAPGNSIGTLAVQGNLVLTAASTYMLEVDPNVSDRTNVTGTATLGGATVNAMFAPGTYVARQYTILNAAGGLSGSTFGPLVNTNLPSGFVSMLSYDANNAFLNLALAFVPPQGGAFSANQQAVANAVVDAFNRNGVVPLAFGALTPAGLTQISGETATGAQQTTFNAMTHFMGVLADPFIGGRDGAPQGGASAYTDEALAYAPRRNPSDAPAAIHSKAPIRVDPFVQRWSIWAAGYGGTQTTEGDAAFGSNTTTSRLAAGAVGLDYRIAPNTLAGFAMAGGGTSFSVANGGTGSSDLFQVGAFVRHTNGASYLTAALAYGWQDVTTDRIVTVAGLDRLQARFNANALSGRSEVGSRVGVLPGGVGLTPYAAAQFTTFALPAFAEQAIVGGNTFALAFASRDVTASRSEIGLRSDANYVMNGARLTLRGGAAWAHDYNVDRSIQASFQTLPGAAFVVNGARPSRDAALATASAEVKWGSGWSAMASFEGEFSPVTTSFAGKGVVRYAW